VVTWTDEHGIARQVTSSLSSSRPALAVGEPVTVRYLPGDPGGASLDERGENIRGALLLVVLGCGFAAAGVYLALTGK
jgi:hypothetical protein